MNERKVPGVTRGSAVSRQTSRFEQDFKRVIASLRSSPLFNVSLGSKELFHSNFLAWLCETYPNEAGRMFARFLKNSPASCDGLKALREHRHIDLSLCYANGETLVVENKVKSIPSREQLEEISASCRSPATTSFLLLSLVPPPFLSPGETAENGFALSGGVKWQYLSYGRLAGDLSVIVPEITNAYHKALLDDYIYFIRSLDELYSSFAIDWTDEQSNFFVARHDMESLRSIRIHDLVDKLRYSELIRRVGDLLPAQGFKVSYGKVSQENQAGEIVLDAGMTNGTGLADFKYLLTREEQLNRSVMLGLQLQGDHFRLVVEMWDNSKAKKAADSLWEPAVGRRVWFDFGLLENASDEYPKDQRRSFNQYSGIFFYRYRQLSGISPVRLAATFVDYARMIRDNATLLRQQLDAGMAAGNVGKPDRRE